MSIKEAVVRWLMRTKPRHSFVVEAEWERSESLRNQDVPIENDVFPDDPWRPVSTLGPFSS